MTSRPQNAPSVPLSAISKSTTSSDNRGAVNQNPAAAFDDLVRRALSFALRNSPKSRQQVAEEMSEMVGVPITLAMLDAYTAESKRSYRFPSAWLVPFCLVTGDTYILRRMAERVGVHMVAEEDLEWIELGKQYYAQTRSQGIIRDVMQRIARREER